MTRPSDEVKEAGGVLAIDVGATNTRAALLAEDGRLLARTAGPTPFDGEPGEIVGGIGDLCETLLADGAQPSAIGIATVGPLDAAAGVVYGPPNLGRGWSELPLGGELGERFGLPVFCERDTNVAALGEQAFGAARGVSDFLYLTISTGIGGAVVAGGRLLLGATGLAGELGHFPIELDGPPCGCGHRGCFEALASGTGIRRAAGADRFADAAVVAAAELAGDAAATAAMTRARAAFAAALVGLVNMFDPALIVVGGAVAVGQGERLLQPARDAIERFAMRPAGRPVAVEAARLGDDCGLLGCLPLVAGAGRPVGPGA